MPATKRQFCTCHLCIKDNPKGRFIPPRQWEPHRKWIEQNPESRPAQDDSNLADDVSTVSQVTQDGPSSDIVEDVTSKIFTRTLTDNPNKHLFCHYTLHTEYPENRGAEPTSNVTPISETINAVIDAMGHLEVDQGKASKPKSVSKQEQNILTSKAHASLNQIKKHLARLLSALDSKSPSIDVISGVERELWTLQATFFGLKCKTKSFKKQKIRVRESFSQLEACIVMCQSVHPAITTPLVFNTGEPFSYM